MYFGEMILGAGTAAGGLVLIIWALIKLYCWKTTDNGDLGIVPIVFAIGVVFVLAGGWQTYESIQLWFVNEVTYTGPAQPSP